VRFVDTSYWVALRFRRDRRHPEAQALWAGVREPLVTTNLVLGETWTFLARRAGHAAAMRSVDAAVRLPSLTIVGVDDELTTEAWTWLRRHDERVYSFVDATSFALMHRLRLREALAFDGDFSAAGFAEVRP
jgi:uncharacterized protein